VITLILQAVGGGSTAAGFHDAHWFVFGAVVLILGASFLLPGRPEPIPAAEPSREPTQLTQPTGCHTIATNQLLRSGVSHGIP
jgi:hypothetical protein